MKEVQAAQDTELVVIGELELHARFLYVNGIDIADLLTRDCCADITPQ